MKKTVKVETAKKFGLVYAISILVGTVVGIGIFLKNQSVFAVNNNNWIGILVAWIIAAVISLSAALSFSEVGSCTADRRGLGSWARKLIGVRVSDFISTTQPFFYYTFVSFSISVFASETFFRIFDNGNNSMHIGVIFTFALFLSVFFATINLIAPKTSGKLQYFLSFLKILPILLVVIMGIVYLTKDSSFSLITNRESSGSFSFINVIISIPAILFAFDSFTGVGTISLDLKNPRKNIPLSIIIGMSLVVIVYLLVTFGCVFSGQGSVLSLFENATFLSQKTSNILNILTTVLLFVSMMGVLNGFSIISVNSCNSYVDNYLIFGADRIKYFIETKLIKRNMDNRSGYVLYLIMYLITWTVFAIPSIIKNTDAFIDGLSNFPTTIFFGIYGLLILAALINRKTKKTEVVKVKGFYIVAPIAIIGCFFVFFFQAFYTFTFRNITEAAEDVKWGLFYGNNVIVPVWQSSIFFVSYVIAMPICYIINDWLKKKFKNKSSCNSALDFKLERDIYE